jgi:DNA polymerase III subunit alpha
VEVMAAQRDKFLAGCAGRKVAPKKAQKLFGLMEEFALYGFPKAHACAYALLAYQTAYLKVHFPVEFMAAMLSSEAGNTEKVVKYINEARGLGIRVLPPCVHESGLYFTPVGDDIRFGLAAIKNVGENTAKAICDARAGGVKFRDLFSFSEAIEPRCLNKRVLESLVKAGALDCLSASRGRLFAAIDQAILRGQRKSQAKAVGQGGLFLAGSSSTYSQAETWHESSLPEAEDWTEEQLLAGEYATLGFYISGHPMDKYAGRLKDLNAIELSTMEARRNGEDIVVAGIIVQSRPMRSRRGARWAILALQDRTGVIEALVFPEAFQKLEAILKANTPLLAKGRVAVEDVGTRLIVSDARLLDQVTDRAPSLLRVRVDLGSVDSGALDRLQELFTKRPGRCRVAFELVQSDGSEATLEAGSAVMADRDLLEQVRQICGTDSVAVVQ